MLVRLISRVLYKRGKKGIYTRLKFRGHGYLKGGKAITVRRDYFCIENKEYCQTPAFGEYSHELKGNHVKKNRVINLISVIMAMELLINRLGNTVRVSSISWSLGRTDDI